MTDSDERELLRETVAALVAKHASPAAVRAAMESDRGYDESLWRRCANRSAPPRWSCRRNRAAPEATAR